MMIMTPVFNVSLLNKIRELGPCTEEELKKAYLPKPQPGVIDSITTGYTDDLQTLIDVGYVIRLEDGRVEIKAYS